MRKQLLGGQQGQTLIYVAVLMVALLLVVGVAIEVGHMYGERRHMQNAADAAALAAARQICIGHPELAESSAAEYARTRNGADRYAITWEDSHTVTVDTEEDVETFVGDLLGTGFYVVPASATATCALASSGCGMFPIAFKASQWDPMATQCGKTFYVWAGDKDDQEAEQGGGKKWLDCNVCDCSMLDPSNSGNVVVTEEGRAWLDFTDVVDPLYPDTCAESNGCGASELKCWVQQGAPEQIAIPACIAGDTGVKEGVRNDIEARQGANVRVPIYDSTCGSSSHGNCTGKYNVVKMGCVTVMGWWDPPPQGLPYLITPTPCHGQGCGGGGGGNPHTCWKGKLIEVAVKCGACDTDCGTTPGQPPQPGGLNAVSLIR